MLKKVAGSFAALTLAVAGVGLLGSAANANTAGAVVTAADILPTETSENYTTWHQGMTNSAGRYASTVDGLLVEGNTQIIKGETVLPNASELTHYVSSSEIDSTGGPVWHQIGIGLAAPAAGTDKNWTTLRSSNGRDWTSSQDFNGSKKNTVNTLDVYLHDLEGELTYLSGGFYVDKKQSATIKSYSVNGVTTSFALGALGAAATSTEYVTESGIRPNEDTYEGWHNGAVAADGASYTSTEAGLEVTGKVQILNGEANSSNQFAQFVTGLAIGTDSTDVWYQVPVKFGAEGFTTLRATQEMAAAGNWTTSRQLGALAANSTASVDEIALALGNHTIIGYGFYVDTGVTATVASFTANGLETIFTKAPFMPRTDIEGAGLGQGAEVAPPAAASTVPVQRGGKIELTAPAGIFEPGETVAVVMHSKPVGLGSFTADATTGAIAGEGMIPADAEVGTHRVLFQGANSYYWAPDAYVVAASDGGDNGAGEGDGNLGGGDGDGGGDNGGNLGGNGNNGTDGKLDTQPTKPITDGKGQPLAVSGGALNLVPMVLGAAALVAGAGLVLMRRRLS